MTLPEWPADCKKREPHAAVTEGAEVLSVLKRERAQLDKANARVGRCAALYANLQTNLK